MPPKCSGRSALDESVLNDTWVSRPTGSEKEEGAAARNRRLNVIESLYKCEDERSSCAVMPFTNTMIVASLTFLWNRTKQLCVC